MYQNHSKTSNKFEFLDYLFNSIQIQNPQY